MELQCPPGYYVTMTTVMYGRQDEETCLGDSLDTMVTSMCEVSGSESIVRKFCDGYQGCYINANKDTFGEECDSGTNYLNVTYDCDGKAFRSQRS